MFCVFKQSTANEMRIRDWSSDGCSSDLWEGGGLEILQKAYDKYNVKVLPCHLTAPEPAGWFNKEIKTPEDFQGLKMRISGLGGKVINKLGASAQLIAGGELYVALERGRIEIGRAHV